MEVAETMRADGECKSGPPKERSRSMAGHREWQQAEHEFLEDNWGNISVASIAKQINRSPGAVIHRAVKKKLGPFAESGDYITLEQLLHALGLRGTYLRDRLKAVGAPIFKKRCYKMTYSCIRIPDFWKWLERDKMQVSLHNMEPFALGLEPAWVKQKRDADIAAYRYTRRRDWTEAEDRQLIEMLKAYRYSYRDICIRLSRTDGGLKRRCLDLGLKMRPLREPPGNYWTDAENEIVKEMWYQGHIAEVMSERINRSASSIKGKLERMIRDGEIDPKRYRRGANV